MVTVIFYLCGRSGVGKDTIANGVLDLVKSLKPLVNYTTREKRRFETEGLEYNFIDVETFTEMCINKKFVTWRSYNVKDSNGEDRVTYYGYPMPEPGFYITSGPVDVLDAYLDTTRGRRDIFVIPYYIMVSDHTKLFKRMVDRAVSQNLNMDETIRRFHSDDKDFTADIEDRFLKQGWVYRNDGSGKKAIEDIASYIKDAIVSYEEMEELSKCGLIVL